MATKPTLSNGTKFGSAALMLPLQGLNPYLKDGKLDVCRGPAVGGTVAVRPYRTLEGAVWATGSPLRPGIQRVRS